MTWDTYHTLMIFLASSDTSVLMSTTISSTSESITIRDPITYSFDLEYLAQVQEETSTMSWYSKIDNLFVYVSTYITKLQIILG